MACFAVFLMHQKLLYYCANYDLNLSSKVFQTLKFLEGTSRLLVRYRSSKPVNGSIPLSHMSNVEVHCSELSYSICSFPARSCQCFRMPVHGIVLVKIIQVSSELTRELMRPHQSILRLQSKMTSTRTAKMWSGQMIATALFQMGASRLQQMRQGFQAPWL